MNGEMEDLSHVNSIPLSNPDISDRERQAVLEVLDTPVLSIGPKLEAFEAAMVKRIGTRYAVGVNSGTSALHLSMIAAGIGPGDEVVTTPFSFVASANAPLIVGARTVFTDIDEETFNLLPEAIEAAITPKTRALLPVHIFGRPCNMPEIVAIAERHGLLVIEDACEALGGTVDGRHVGGFGMSGVFGFYPNKQITTGEGGMFVTDDETAAQTARSLRNQGRAQMTEWLDHERLGYNYRLSELASALGLVQMERLDEILEARSRVSSGYLERLESLPGLILPAPPGEGLPNREVELSWFVFVIRVEGGLDRREAVIRKLQENNIGCGRYFPAIHLLRYFRETHGYRPGDYPVTERVAESTIALPFYSRLSEAQVDRVVTVLRDALHDLPVRS